MGFHFHKLIGKKALIGPITGGEFKPKLLLRARSLRGLILHEQKDKDPPPRTEILVCLVLGFWRKTKTEALKL